MIFKMIKQFTDAKTGITYTLQGDYYLPDLSSPAEEEIPIGVWGRGCPVDTSAAGRSADRGGSRDQRHKQFLKNYQRNVYNEFLVSGKLQQYLAQLDRDAQEMFDLLVRQLAKQEGITETLKAENQMEWVQRMNSIRSRATEIVNHELIYV